MQLKRTLLALFVLVLCAGTVWAQAPVVTSGWDAFVIRENAIEGAPYIEYNDAYGEVAVEFVTFAGSQKAGLGTNQINGATLSQIATLHVDRLDDPAGSGSEYGPYFNVWVTDGAGQYAVIANEPSDAEWAGSRWDVADWAFLSTKRAKVYEVPGAAGGGDPGTSWVATYASDNGWDGVSPLRFADIAGLEIAPPPASYIQNPANAVSGGAPRELSTDVAYGYNWIFGDTMSNYVTGAEGFVVNNYYATTVYNVENTTQGTTYATIEAALIDADPNDTIAVANGTYNPTGTLNINQGVTLIGASQDGTIINIPAAGGYGISIAASNVTLQNFTMNCDAANENFPIHASGTSNSPNGFDNLTISNFTIQGAHRRTGFDIHGFNNVDLSGLVSKDAWGGNGLQVTGCVDVDMDNITCVDNDWGSIAIYCSQTSYLGRGSDDVYIDAATLTLDGAVFSQDEFGFTNTNINLDGWDYAVTNSRFREAINEPDSEGYTFFVVDQAAALATALGFAGYEEYSAMENLFSDVFEVVPGLTIQAAIDEADPADTIEVAAGHYEEQLHVTTENLTLTGAGQTQTFIESPQNLALFYTTSANNYPVVFVDGVSAFSMAELTVDGLGRGNDNYRFQGVGFWNSGGTLTMVNVDNVMDTPFSGSQHAVGVYAYNNTGGPYAISLTDVNVNDYQKGGVALSGEGLTVALTRVNTPGQGPTGVTAQNGIQVSFGAGGSIVDCTVSDIEWTGGAWVASGILTYAASSVTIDGATITDVQSSINNQDSDLTLKNSTVTGATVDGAYTYVTASKAGDRRSTPSPLLEDWQGNSKATATVLYDNCSFTGAGSAGSWGAGIYLSGGNGDLTVTNCEATNFDYGLVVWEDGGAATGFAHENSFSGNLSFEAGIYTAAPYDIAFNYWGGANPGDVVDFTAKATPLYSPWYMLPLGTVPMTWGTNSGIQAVLDVANPGDTINVQPGTYDENLVFNKSVNLLGPNATNSPNTGTRGAEAVLMPSSGSGILGNAADIDVYFAGMTVDMDLAPDGDRFMNQTGKTGTSWVFEHNIFLNGPSTTSGNWLMNGNNLGLEFSLLDNYFSGNDVSNGISIWDVNPFTINVQDNVWENNEYTAMNLNHAQGVISNNIFRDTRTIDFNDPGYQWYLFQSGILLAGEDFDLDITGNHFENIQYGVTMYANVDGPIDITNNIFDGVAVAGIRGSDSQAVPGSDLADVTVMNNQLINYFGTDYMVWNSRSDMQILNAEYNWWGDSTGPYHPTNNPTGQGVPVSDYVLFTPWTNGGTATMDPTVGGPISCGDDATLTVNLTTGTMIPDVFGFTATVRASSEVEWNGITDLEAFGSTTQFLTFNNGDGSYLISGTTLGNPTQPISGAGVTPLFSMTFTGLSGGTADITFEEFLLRDATNDPINAAAVDGTIEVDCTAPPAVADITATPDPTSTDNGVEVTWTIADNSDVDHYEIWRAMWDNGDGVTSAYPEYDDVNPIEPVRASSRAVLDASAEWSRVSNTVVGTATSFIDLGMVRGVYYYEVVAIDEAGNAGPLAAANDRATSYFLGDFDGNGFVNGSGDLTPFGTAFGTTPSHALYNNETDIGPTDTNQGLGIPATDNYINFEDLMIFSLNYGVVGTTKSELRISEQATMAWVDFGDNRYALRLLDADGLKGVHLRVTLSEDASVTVVEGDLLKAQSEPTFLRNLGNGVDVNAAVLGNGVGFSGEGDLFIVESSQPLTIDDLAVDLRGADNGNMEVSLTSESGTMTPRVFGLYANYPNPFNPMTKISYSLPEEQPVRLNVYGIDGRLVRQLVNETRGSGMHEVIWDGRSDSGRMQASGLYFYRIEAGPYSQVHKMTLMK